MVDLVAATLLVRFELIGNEASRQGVDVGALGADSAVGFLAALTLSNPGEEAIPPGPWAIRLSTIRRILDVGGPFRAAPVTGDLVELRPTEAFEGLRPGQSLRVDLVMEYWMCFQSDVMPRWYVIAPGAQARVLACTDTEDLGAFVAEGEPQVWRRHHLDRTTYQVPATRYAGLAEVPDVAHDPTRIVPPAREVTALGGRVDLSAGVAWQLPLPGDQVQALAAAAAELGVPAGPYRIEGALIDQVGQPPGSYLLAVGAAGARIEAADLAGLRHGSRTLLALVDPTTGMLPAVRVADGPRFAYRGLMVDLARNMVGLPVLHRLVEEMAAVKLNVLHLHLSDDEGWRLEIPGLPELTDVGGRRGHTEDESDRLLPQLGSGPSSDTSGSGWLTRDQYVGLVRAAAARGVEVIPEIDMPAHCRAAVVAMEARYRHILAHGGSEDAASAYRLVHPLDTTRLTTIQYNDRRSTIDPCLPSTERFLDHVMGQVAQMHAEAGAPLTTWHYGGDEAVNVLLGAGFSDLADPKPGTGVIDRSGQDEPWSGSPAVRAAIARGELADPHQIPAWFAVRVAHLAQRHGIGTLQAWQDGLRHAGSAADFPIRTRVNLWDTMAWGAPVSLPAEQAKGYEVVLTIPDFLYLDFPSEVNAHERGYYWAMRAVDQWRAFAWAPGNLPQNAEVHDDRDGWPLNCAGPGPGGPIHGLSAVVFGEMIRTDEQFEAQVFPRLLAVAERAWHTPSWERPYEVGRSFEKGRTHDVDLEAVRADFAGHLAVVGRRELARLERAGVAFAIGPPGAILEQGVLHMRARFPGLACQYSLDGGATWTTWQEPVAVATSGAILVRCTSPSGRRSSRVETVAP
jgi:hexosaminidase